MSVVPEFVGDSTMRIGDTVFHYEWPLDVVPPDHLGIEKSRALLEAYLELWDELRPRRVVELGVREGGSTAMLFELGGAERIVSVELSDTRPEALDRYVDAHGAQDVVHPHYGVDQADTAQLARILDDEFAGAPLDLVIDDASHLYRESRASFDLLFPALRPGGLYLLEDWRWQHEVAAHLTSTMQADDAVRREIERRMVDEDLAAPATAVSRLVLELVIARAISGDAVESVTVGHHWAAVRRGPADLDRHDFRLDEFAPDHLQLLAPVR